MSQREENRWVLGFFLSVLGFVLVGCVGGGGSASTDSVASGPTDPSGITPEDPPAPPPPVTPPPAEDPPPAPSEPRPVIISWDSPSQNVDGSPLVDLLGFNVYIGTSPGVYTEVVDAGDVNTHTFDSLSVGTHYFAVSAYDSWGNESDLSEEVVATVASLCVLVASAN
jgi:hypothetical protein